jgi:CRP-like cAMP-binding protein
VPRIALEQLAAAAQSCPLPPGVDVVVQGAPAHAFYAVADGRVVVHRDGKAVVHLGPGDSFGERGLLDHAPRNATVTTEMDTTLLRVEGRALLDALEAAPALRPRWISAAPRPESRSRRARPRWWTTRAGHRHDHRRATVIVVGGGYEGKRRYYQRLARLGARLVIGDEPGHWSESLVDQIAGTQWLATPQR